MKKIIQRTKRFEKAFKKLTPKIQKLFIEKLKIFIEDQYASSLDTHKLKGQRKQEMSFSVTNDIRVIYEKLIEKNKEVVIFKFINIGAHSRVY